MRRREFIALIRGVATAFVLPAHPQQAGAMRRRRALPGSLRTLLCSARRDPASSPTCGHSQPVAVER
jgi:hypothetical protein